MPRPDPAGERGRLIWRTLYPPQRLQALAERSPFTGGGRSMRDVAHAPAASWAAGRERKSVHYGLLITLSSNATMLCPIARPFIEALVFSVIAVFDRMVPSK